MGIYSIIRKTLISCTYMLNEMGALIEQTGTSNVHAERWISTSESVPPSLHVVEMGFEEMTEKVEACKDTP